MINAKVVSKIISFWILLSYKSNIKFLLGMIVRVFDGDLSETQQEAFSKFRERNSRKFTLRPKTNQFQTTNSFT